MNTPILSPAYKVGIVAAMLCTAAFAQVPCDRTRLPRMPVQVTMYLPAQNPVASATQPTKFLGQLVPLPVISNRYLVLESISIKGTHPSNTYLAVELRTTVAVPAKPTDWVRHFIYSKQSQSEYSALHLREGLNLLAAPDTPVYIGVQSTSGSSIDQMDVTVTGYSVDACRWGQ